AREAAYLKALERLANRATSDGDLLAADYWRRLLRTDPLREDAVRSLMEVLAAKGNLAEVEQLFRDVRTRLHRTMNIDASPETHAVYRRILTARPVPDEKLRSRGGHPRRFSPRLHGGDPCTALSSLDLGAPALRQTLPIPLTSLIGREAEVRAVRDFVS